MPTTYTNGLKLPDLGSIDWYNSYKNNIDILDPIVGTVNGVATTYAPISHNHSASEITSGTIDIARLPPAALERMHIVADQTARYALTTSTVQEGDTVKQTDTGVMYLVVDSTKLNSADGYTEYSAGTASKAIADEDGTSIKTGYVNVAGNQTVTGDKTWTGSNTFNNILPNATNTYSLGSSSYQWSSVYAQTYYYNGTAWGLDKENTWAATQTVKGAPPTLNLQSTNIQRGVAPASNSNLNLYGKDLNGAELCRLIYRASPTGERRLWLGVNDNYSNGALSPTGTSTWNSLNLYLRADGKAETTFSADLLPATNNSYNLGTSTNQWNKTYSKEYYYNGTAWGLDKANVWTQSQTISINLPAFTLQDIYGERDKTPGNTRQLGIYFCDKTGATYSFINRQHRATTGTHLLQANIENGTYDYRLQFYLYTDGGSDFVPSNDGIINLGTSANKWKTLNGINPGALGIPDKDNMVNIASEFTDLTGGFNYYIPPADGFVSINADTDVYCAVVSSTHNTAFWRQSAVATSTGYASVTIPVRAGLHLQAKIKSTVAIYAAFFPCLGNV